MKKNRKIIYTSATALATALLLGSGCASDKPAACCAPAAATSTATPAAPAMPMPIPTAVVVRPVLKLVSVDSEETAGEDGKGANAVDGDPNTFWHTQWQDASPACPHEIVIELTPPATIKGVTYLPRQDDGLNGTIKGYELFASNDGKDFGAPVATGEFAEGKELKTVAFAPQACRFIKLKAVSEINGEAWSSAAEIGVVTQ